MTGTPQRRLRGVLPLAGLGLLALGFLMVMGESGGDAGAVLMALGVTLTVATLWLALWRTVGPVARGLLVLGPVLGAIAALVVWGGMPPRDRVWIAFYGPVLLGGATLAGMALAGLARLLGSRPPAA